MTSVSDAAGRAIGEQTAGCTKKKTTTERETAVNEIKDKYQFDFCNPTVCIHNIHNKTPLIAEKQGEIVGNPHWGGTVVGKLKANLNTWADMKASNFILEGYKIPFITTPRTVKFRNNKSALRNKFFVETTIDALLDSGRIVEVHTPPEVVNPLTVSEKGLKKRLILDLRYLNAHIWTEHSKFEDFGVFQHFIRKGSFMFNFDFTSGYHHIDIFEEHRCYLGFSWTRNGIKTYYCFCVLPFGLCTAGYIFTKVCRVLVKYWRSHGIKLVLYIDDGIGAAVSYAKCVEAAQFVKKSIEDSGFVINNEKSNWEPSQTTTWLGLEINTASFTIKITQKRIHHVLAKITAAKSKRVCSAREVASIAGGIISQEIVLGDISGLFTREMYYFIVKAAKWDTKNRIPDGTIAEFCFWQQNIERLNLKYLRVSAVSVRAMATANSDASSVASGAVVRIGQQNFTAHKNLSATEKVQSSTWRELDAVLFSLKSFAPLLKGKPVHWETDNQAVPVIIHRGSSKPHLQRLAKDVYYACRDDRIDLNINWVPWEENLVADQVSKYVDFDDWTTSEHFFRNIDARWGPFTIDRFADHENAKTKRFNSLFWTPTCEAVDAFTQDWGHDVNWLVPPIYLISKVIRHAEGCRAKGTLIVPLWESSAYWPLLCKRRDSYHEFVLDVTVLPDTTGILEIGNYRESVLGSPRFKSPLLAINFQF